MERRAFVKGLAAAAAAVQAWPELAHGAGDRLERLRENIAASSGGDDLWRRVRSEFRLDPGHVHLNTGSTGACPEIVTNAVAEAMAEYEGNPQDGTFGVGIRRANEVRARAAEFIGADVSEVSITRNTTEGMNQVATGIDLAPGDEVLTTNHEHGGGLLCWHWLQQRRGVQVNYLDMPDPVQSAEQFLRLFEQHLTPRTRVVSLMHVDTITGMTYPLAEVAKITRPRGILLICDGAHAPGMLDVDVRALGVDTYASSSHKWMLAPKGSGLLYIRREVQDRVVPVNLFKGYSYYTGAVGTRNMAQAIGHGTAMDFHNAIGRPVVEARCRELSDRLRRHLRQIDRLRLLTPDDPALSSGLVTFAVDGLSAGTIESTLMKEHSIRIKVAQGTYAYAFDPALKAKAHSYNANRYSTHIFNTEAEVDRVASLVEDMLKA
jgi:selenocysteine lyase/cysteine desulfurase